MRHTGALTLVLFSWLSSSIPAFGHHSFAMFDRSKRATLEGTVREIQWTNPHIFIQLTVMENSRPIEYSIEGQSPNGLIRAGWKKNTIKAGDRITVTFAPLRDGTNGGSFISCVLPDGRTITNGQG